MTSRLFSPLQLRGITLKNRIGVSPMAQYSSDDGRPNMWHAVHLGCRAVGGAGLVMSEAIAVSEEGRISPRDIGIWSDEHVRAFQPIVEFIKAQGAVAGAQIGHAGRKGSTPVPWVKRGGLDISQGGWETVAPSAIPFSEAHAQPREMTEGDIERVVGHFRGAAARCREAGFEVLELHMAHGYLFHQFLSPLTNRRTDDYGGSLEGRAAMPLRVVEAVRAQWPEHLPLFVRISATDWLPGGWDLEQSVQFASWLCSAGVDLIDCSSGAIAPGSQVQPAPGFQVPFASEIRKRAAIATAAVGGITEVDQAEAILREGRADLIMLARVLLEDPYWPLRAFWKLEGEDAWPPQYTRSVRRAVRSI